MNRLVLVLSLCAVVAGCGGESVDPKGTEGAENEEAVLKVYANFQEAILFADGELLCDILANDRVQDVERQDDVSVDCATAASLGLGSFTDEEREAVRSAQGKSDTNDVEIDGGNAGVTTPSGNEVQFVKEGGNWKLDLPIP